MFNGLSIMEALETLRLLEKSSESEQVIFRNINFYLHERIKLKKNLSEAEIASLEELRTEIENFFYGKYKNKLLAKISCLEPTSFKNPIKDIATLDINGVAEFCKREHGGKDKYVFKRIDWYLTERINCQKTLSTLEMQDIEQLMIEIKRRFWRNNQGMEKKKLFNSIKELVNCSKQKMVFSTKSLNEMTELCKDTDGVSNTDCFNIIFDELLKRIKYDIEFKCEELEQLENFISEISKRFSETDMCKNKKKLIKKLKILLTKLVKKYTEKNLEWDLAKLEDFCWKVRLANEAGILKLKRVYFDKRIEEERLLEADELELANTIKENLENNPSKTIMEVKLYDKLRLLQVKSSINTNVADQDDDLFKIKEILVQKGKSNGLYTIVWDIINELDRESVDSQRLSVLLRNLNEKIKSSSIRRDNFVLVSRLLSYIENLKYSDKLNKVLDYESVTEVLEQCKEDFESRHKIKYLNEEKIKNKFIDGTIILNKEFSLPLLASIKFPSEKLEIANKIIFAIDSATSVDLDGALSIVKDGSCYVFDVYVTDVPSFLKDNRHVCEEAYSRGSSFYVRDHESKTLTVIGMLPEILSNDYLSLRNNQPRNVLDFQFIFNAEGDIISTNISRKLIRVTYNLTPEFVEKVVNEKNDGDAILYKELMLYKELIKKVSSRTSYKYLADLVGNSVFDYMAFPSVLTNYFIANNSEFSIYRDQGRYTLKPVAELYSHSVIPLRKFVSDINLAFFLNQEGIVNFSDKDLNYVEKNIEQIIEHLNCQEELNCFIEKNGEFVKKYIR